MKPAPFAYHKARSLDDAVAMLAANEDARLLAGGQSLIATLNMRLSAPAMLIDINGIGGLDEIALKDGKVEIGALTRHTQAERSDVIARHAPLIARAMPHIAHVAIRNRGTLGGSIAFADPAAELPACLLALDGEVEATGPKGQTDHSGGGFLPGPVRDRAGARRNADRDPAAGGGQGQRVGFAELARRHGDYAIVGLAATARASSQGLSDVRLAYFGVGNTPMRAKKAEAALETGDVNAAVAALDLDPEDDVQATAAVKKHLAGVLLRRVAAQLMEAR